MRTKLLRRLRRKAERQVTLHNSEVCKMLEKMFVNDISEQNRKRNYVVRSVEERMNVLRCIYIKSQIYTMRVKEIINGHSGGRYILV